MRPRSGRFLIFSKSSLAGPSVTKTSNPTKQTLFYIFWKMSMKISTKSKKDCENLIKPIEFEAFLRHEAEKCSKMIGKALPREGFRVAFSRTPETL